MSILLLVPKTISRDRGCNVVTASIAGRKFFRGGGFWQFEQNPYGEHSKSSPRKRGPRSNAMAEPDPAMLVQRSFQWAKGMVRPVGAPSRLRPKVLSPFSYVTESAEVQLVFPATEAVSRGNATIVSRRHRLAHRPSSRFCYRVATGTGIFCHRDKYEHRHGASLRYTATSVDSDIALAPARMVRSRVTIRVGRAPEFI